MQLADRSAEVARTMTICNACRYCEGICAVFPAMERRRQFSLMDTEFLANLCHNCGACYHDCQYVPPHEFNINVPATMAGLRESSYEHHAWPAFGTRWVTRSPLLSALGLVATLTLLLVIVALQRGVAVLGANHGDNFYAILTHGEMVTVFGVLFGYAVLALAMGVRSFWRGMGGGRPTLTDYLGAMRDAATLRNLGGGGGGCMDDTDRPTVWRKWFHHATFYGFMLCFVATCLGTLFHYGLSWSAPYGWLNPVVILGTIGGVGLIVGPIGLLIMQRTKYANLQEQTASRMDQVLLWTLLWVSVTGFWVLGARGTHWLGLSLVVHLATVGAFFVSMPYGKFVHGFYRLAALVRDRMEQRDASCVPTTKTEREVT